MPAPSAHHLVVDNLHDLFRLRPRLCCSEVGGGGLDEGLAETNGGPQRMGAGKLVGKPGETMSFGMFLAMFPGAFWWICLQSAFWNELWLLGGTALKKSKKSPRTQGRNINHNPGDQTTVPHGNGKIELQKKKKNNNHQSSPIERRLASCQGLPQRLGLKNHLYFLPNGMLLDNDKGKFKIV